MAVGWMFTANGVSAYMRLAETTRGDLKPAENPADGKTTRTSPWHPNALSGE
jgi:hypothetical protein